MALQIVVYDVRVTTHKQQQEFSISQEIRTAKVWRQWPSRDHRTKNLCSRVTPLLTQQSHWAVRNTGTQLCFPPICKLIWISPNPQFPEFPSGLAVLRYIPFFTYVTHQVNKSDAQIWPNRIYRTTSISFNTQSKAWTQIQGKLRQRGFNTSVCQAADSLHYHTDLLNRGCRVDSFLCIVWHTKHSLEQKERFLESLMTNEFLTSAVLAQLTSKQHLQWLSKHKKEN